MNTTDSDSSEPVTYDQSTYEKDRSQAFAEVSPLRGMDISSAEDILQQSSHAMRSRSASRDNPNERSMRRAVDAFNGLTGLGLTETQGWTFMVILKLARAENGNGFNLDDYVDGAAYMALAGECQGMTGKSK